MRWPPRATASPRARRGSQRNHSLIACVCFAALAISVGEPSAEEARVFYKYTDDAGGLHMVQSLDRVPPQYRNQIGKIEFEGDPLWTKSAAERTAPRPRVEYQPVQRRSPLRVSGVVLYYADWCGYCKKAKRWLDEHSIAYDIRDIDIPRYGDELMDVSGSKSIPVLSIDGELVRGFRPEAYESALGG